MMESSRIRSGNLKASLKNSGGGLIAAYLLMAAILILGSLLPLGQSGVKSGEILVDLTAGDGKEQNREINSRTYSESSAFTVSENLKLNTVQISYCAPDKNFKGHLTVAINGPEGVVGESSADIVSTGETKTFSAVNLDFYRPYENGAAQLVEGHKYTLNLQLDMNEYSCTVKEVSTSGQSNNTPFQWVAPQMLVTNISFTPTFLMRYWDAFYGFILLPIIAGGYILLKKLNIDLLNSTLVQKTVSLKKLNIDLSNNTLVQKNVFLEKAEHRFVKQHVGTKTVSFVRHYYCEIILLLVFVFLSLYEFYFSYLTRTGITPDSTYYLREANALLNGYGFNVVGPSGYSEWFAAFPIGYSLMIAAVAFITGKSAYLASKLLAILLVGLFLLLLYIRFRKDAWIYSICLFNLGFLKIYMYTWSENPFILGLLAFCLVTEHIVTNEQVKMRWYAGWGLCSFFLFICRYFGAFSLIIIGLFFLFYFCMYFWGPREKKQNTGRKLIGCMLSGTLSGVMTGAYFLMNYIHTGTFSGVERSMWWDDYTTLTYNLYDSLVTEIKNALCMVLPDTLNMIAPQFQMLAVFLFAGFLCFLLLRNKQKDFKEVFIGAGVFYIIVFTLVRYHSGMDAFGYRFFAPAGMLITIGVLGFAAQLIKRYKKQIALVFTGLLLVVTVGLAICVKAVGSNGNAFDYLEATVKDTVKDVPNRSTVLEEKLPYETFVFRPDINNGSDINNDNFMIGTDDTMDALLERYGKSDCICIKAKYIKDIVYHPVYDFDSSVTEFFAAVPEDTPDEQYLVVSIPERKLCDTSDFTAGE